jgi:hypothetical protein
MSSKPTGPDSPFQRLRDEGYEVEIRQQHLLVHRVPFISSERVIRHGSLVCTYVENAGELMPPDNHQVWFTGDFPCSPEGIPLGALVNESTKQELFKDCVIRHRFSNKPFGLVSFTEHYSKMIHYITLLSHQARAIDSKADAKTGRVIEASEEESVFRYADTASVRAEISMVTSRLKLKRLAVIGLGGTGAYVLDQIAKTPVREIHLYDSDEFLQHNAFRAPGAATAQQLQERMNKTEYFRRQYDPMHCGIISHPYRIDGGNLDELALADFICIDKGSARALICNYLQSLNIKFIDVGMGIEMIPDSRKLFGSCRVTLSTEIQKNHLNQYAPMMEDQDDDNLYRQNIQVADLNALNAILAVLKWKQVYGFYQDDFQSHNLTFTSSTSSLVRDITLMTNIE